MVDGYRKMLLEDEEVFLIKKIRGLRRKQHDFELLDKISLILDAISEINDEKEFKMLHWESSFSELKTALKIAESRTRARNSGKKLGGRKSKIEDVIFLLKNAGWDLLCNNDILFRIDSNYSKSTIYKALKIWINSNINV